MSFFFSFFFSPHFIPTISPQIYHDKTIRLHSLLETWERIHERMAKIIDSNELLLTCDNVPRKSKRKKNKNKGSK